MNDLGVDVVVKVEDITDDPNFKGYVMITCNAPGREPGYFCRRKEEYESIGGLAFAEQYIRDRGGLPNN